MCGKSYLAELLLNKGYKVHGIIRRSSSFNTGRIEHIYQDSQVANRMLFLHYGDMTDSSNIASLISSIKPNEIYNLAAQSHVKVSFETSEYTSNVDALGTLRLLNAVRSANLESSCRLYQASTSELFGKVREVPQSETTPFYPRSPYAVAKQFAFWMLVNYREAYGMHLSNGILFNHESPRRGATFVTRKITRAVARIKCNLQDTLYLGNIDSKRDWGHAKDYVEAMWLILQQDIPDDYVCATGEMHTVREFVELAFSIIGVEIVWQGEKENETGSCKKTGRIMVKIDPKYYRPTEVEQLLGNAAKATKKFGWKPKITFHELVKEMVLADVELVKAGDLIS